MSTAYFCLEYALEESLPGLYAGGLGVLAGDLVLEVGGNNGTQNGFQMVFVGLGYGQTKDLENAGYKKIAVGATRGSPVLVEIGEEEVEVGAWEKYYGTARVILLKDISGSICRELYGPDNETMLKQQLILGIGGVRWLNKLAIDVEVYHLNEGHCAMAILEIQNSRTKVVSSGMTEENVEMGNKKIVSTKHTLLSGAGLHLTYDELKKPLELYCQKYQIDFDELFNLGTHISQPGIFSTTNFLIKHSQKASAVSNLHARYEKAVHPQSELIPITNGVCVSRWDQIKGATPENIWEKHQENKIKLLDTINTLGKTNLNPDFLTIVWARRLVEYKRPLLIFDDLDRLIKIVNGHGPKRCRGVQIIIAGKTHPGDLVGKHIVETLQKYATSPDLSQRLVFWNSYDLSRTLLLTTGADIWLNTPIVGREACGTSGMKAGLNGAVQISTNDGWFAEVDWSGESGGWVLDETNTAQSLYRTMEEEVVPAYYNFKEKWIARMFATRKTVLARFSAERMVNDYQKLLYL